MPQEPTNPQTDKAPEVKTDVAPSLPTVELVDNSKNDQLVDTSVALPDSGAAKIDDLPSPKFEDFLAVSDRPNMLPEPKAPKVDEPAKVEDKVEEPKVDDVKKDDTTPKTTVTKVARDYEGFSDDEKAKMSKMSNEAFDWVKPIIKEHKNLGNLIKQKDEQIVNLKKGAIPDSYYEHPQAFTLDPAYNIETQRLQLSEAYVEHWQNQYANIEDGKPWQTIDINKKTGQLIYGEPQEVNPETKGRVKAGIVTALQHCQNQVNNYRNNVNTIQNTYRMRHETNVAAIKQTEEKFFKVYDDAKHPYNAVVKNMLESIPVEFRGSPLASIFAKTATGLLQSSNVNKELQTELAKWRSGELTVDKANKGAASVNGNSNDKKVALADEKKKAAGPTDSDVVGAGLGNKVVSNDNLGTNFDDFDKYLKEN